MNVTGNAIIYTSFKYCVTTLVNQEMVSLFTLYCYSSVNVCELH